MEASVLIDVNALVRSIAVGNCVVVDCRFDLSDTEWGLREYGESHIPTAFYAHLDRDLSAPVIPGVTGRHPLPDPENLAALVRSLGIETSTTVVVYDQAGGGIATRAWWLFRWIGIPDVRLLDGGWAAWTAAGFETSSEIPVAVPSSFQPDFASHMEIPMDAIAAYAALPSANLIDARAPERFAGVVEPIDHTAGHIPGAVNLPFQGNLSEGGLWKPAEELRNRFSSIGIHEGDDVVVYCGSGVTACHVIFAYELAGLGKARLYSGSWSEWITRDDNPIATGAS